MGFPTINQFDRNFIERTIENLSEDVTNRYTLLVNSLFGLIIVPNQWLKQNKADPKGFQKKWPTIKGLQFLKGKRRVRKKDKVVEKDILSFKHGGKKVEDFTLGEIVERLRNSIAHLAFRPTEESGAWRGIIFRSYSTDDRAAKWMDNYDMEIYLEMNDLKDFVHVLAECYLNGTESAE